MSFNNCCWPNAFVTIPLPQSTYKTHYYYIHSLNTILTAVDDYDPISIPNLLTFPEGSVVGREICIFVQIEDDNITDSGENLFVMLEAVDSLTVNPNMATVIIIEEVGSSL